MEENTAVLDTPEVVKHTGAEWYRDVSLEDAEVFIRSNLQSAVRSVIATGFYLKHIRDNELYLEAGYKNVKVWSQCLCHIQVHHQEHKVFQGREQSAHR